MNILNINKNNCFYTLYIYGYCHINLTVYYFNHSIHFLIIILHFILHVYILYYMFIFYITCFYMFFLSFKCNFLSHFFITKYELHGTIFINLRVLWHLKEIPRRNIFCQFILDIIFNHDIIMSSNCIEKKIFFLKHLINLQIYYCVQDFK